MVKINKIYTRTGDDGTTGLVGGARVSKDSERVEAYGEIDELNAYLGVCRTLAERECSKNASLLAQIQNTLFDLGSELATPAGQTWEGMITVHGDHVQQLERWIDQLTADLPELRSFVLPGGNDLNGYLHIARTICRRAERRILRLQRSEDVSKEVIAYVNRLSDLLFAMARSESARIGTPEYLWQPGAKVGS